MGLNSGIDVAVGLRHPESALKKRKKNGKYLCVYQHCPEMATNTVSSLRAQARREGLLGLQTCLLRKCSPCPPWGCDTPRRAQLCVPCLVSHAGEVPSVRPCVQSTVLAQRTRSPHSPSWKTPTYCIVSRDTFGAPNSILTVSFQIDQESGSMLSSDKGIQWQKYSRTNSGGLQKWRRTPFPSPRPGSWAHRWRRARGRLAAFSNPLLE